MKYSIIQDFSETKYTYEISHHHNKSKKKTLTFLSGFVTSGNSSQNHFTNPRNLPGQKNLKNTVKYSVS